MVELIIEETSLPFLVLYLVPIACFASTAELPLNCVWWFVVGVTYVLSAFYGCVPLAKLVWCQTIKSWMFGISWDTAATLSMR